MKLNIRHTLLVGLIATSASLPALANQQYQDKARVLSVTPQVEKVNDPIKECRTEYVRERVTYNQRRSNTGAVLGGVTGGLLGSTIGKGNGRVVAAVLGAGVGAIVGDRVDNGRRYQDQSRRGEVVTRPVETCQMIDRWSEVTTGYLVNYEYNGRQYTTVTQSDPGRYVNVDVSVRPRDYITEASYQPRNHRRHQRANRKHNRQYW